MDNNINKYHINFKGNQYIISTEIYQNNIRITCIQPNNSNSLDYTFDTSLETLKQLSTAFHSTLTIKDAKDLIDKIIEEEKIEIQNIGNQINLILYLAHQNENAILPLNPSLTNMANTAYIQQNIPTEPIVLPPIYSQDPLQQTANMNIPMQEEDIYGLNNLQEPLSVVHKIPNNILQNPQNYYYPGNYDNMNYITNNSDNNVIKGDHEKIKSDINNLSTQVNQLKEQVNLLNQNLNNLNQIPNQNIYKISNPNNINGNIILKQENEKPPTEGTNYNNINSNYNNNYDNSQKNNNISDFNQNNNMNDQNNDNYNQIDNNNQNNSIYNQNNDNYNQNNDNYIQSDNNNQNNDNYNQSDNNNQNNSVYNQNNDNYNQNNDNYNQNNNNQNNSIYNQNNDNYNQNNDNYNQNNNIYNQNNNNMEDELSHYKTKIQELENERDKSLRENDNLKSQIQNLINTNNMYQTQYQNLLKNQKGNQIDDFHIVNGNIFRNNKEIELVVKKLCINYGKIYIDLIYKASVDSDKAAAFHQKCDNAENSLVLVESRNGKRFGGFTSCDWKGDSIMKKDDNAFIFSLDKMEIYDVIPGEDAIGCFPNYGPIFSGCQIKIKDEAFSNGGSTFERGINYYTNEDYELTGGDKEFLVKEIEVYSVKFE